MKELTQVLLQKIIDIIRSLSQENEIIYFPDGYSDNVFDEGGTGVLFLQPSGAKTELKVSAGLNASNFSCGLIAIKEALSFHLSRHSDDSVGSLIAFLD